MNLWQVSTTGPVIKPGQLHPRYDHARAGAAHVVPIGATYTMLYWGASEGRNYILRATSPVAQPNQWKAADGPLLAAQPTLDYNCHGPSFPFLLPVTPDDWRLYFCAWGKPVATGKLPNTTGVARSRDGGLTWQYVFDRPMISLDRPYDREGTGSVWVLHESGRFRMYYTALGRYFPKPAGVTTGHGDVIPEIGIAYAESADGISWTKPLTDLVVRPRGFGVTPYEYICSKPCVIRNASGYIMWVNTFGSAYRVHRLTSRDGLRWDWAERQGSDGELGIGAPGSFDSHQRSYPTVVQHGAEWRCWYTGNGFGDTGMGYAVSRD